MIGIASMRFNILFFIFILIMKISEFKEGDIITRTGRTDVKFGGGTGLFGMEARPAMGDGSYIGDKLLFLGIVANCIWYNHLEGVLASDSIHKMSMDDWNDDHWDYYPEDKLKEWREKYKHLHEVKQSYNSSGKGTEESMLNDFD